MSHSDSEVNLHKKHLGPKFKAKNVFKGLSGPQYATIKHKLKTLRKAKLLVAASRNNTEGVEREIGLGASPNTYDEYGRSALHIAASKGYTDVVRLLLDKGADPNQSDNLLNTPLHLAACTHNLGVISLLLKSGADVRKLDIYGKNPIQLAESKLLLLQRSWKDGCIENVQLITELRLIVDIMISVLQQSQVPAQMTSVDDLQLMKLSIGSENGEALGDQMTKLLQGLQNFQIS